MNTDAVIYVIDSQDDTYYEESKNQFHKVLRNSTLKNATILIFANKQDLPGAKTINQIIQDYELDKIKNHSWQIQPCSALRGEGLIEGLKWLSEQLVFRGKNDFPNNPYENNENEEKEGDKKINISNMINADSEMKINVNNDADNNININNNAEQHKENVNEIENSENNINNEIINKPNEV